MQSRDGERFHGGKQSVSPANFQSCFLYFFMCRLFLSTRQFILAVCLLSIFSQSNAELLKDYKWTNRVIVTFWSAESNPDRLQLIQQIKQYSCQYRKRDLVHIDLIEGT